LTPAATEVFHLERCRHGCVTFFLSFSGICPSSENVSSKINDLKNCLFFRHIGESVRKQGKFRHAKKFPAELSTKTVDSFSLALGLSPLQPRAGIDDSRMQVTPRDG
jgi:hypothetical protein